MTNQNQIWQKNKHWNIQQTIRTTTEIIFGENIFDVLFGLAHVPSANMDVLASLLGSCHIVHLHTQSVFITDVSPQEVETLEGLKLAVITVLICLLNVM